MVLEHPPRTDALRQTAFANRHELRKERFAFASGNILVLGLLTLQAWPWVASYQAEGDVQESFFIALVVLLATACSSVLFALSHILTWGVLLAVSDGATDQSRVVRMHAIADRSYQACFFA